MRENARINGVEEEPDEPSPGWLVWLKKTGITITAKDASTCHRLTGGSKGPKPLKDKLVRQDTEHQLTKHKRNLKETSTFVNDDLSLYVQKEPVIFEERRSCSWW